MCKYLFENRDMGKRRRLKEMKNNIANVEEVGVSRNISPSADRSCSNGLNGSDLEQMSERQGMKTLPGCCRHQEYYFDTEHVYL